MTAVAFVDSLHKKAYQHRVGNVVEIMHCDALTLAQQEGSLQVPGKDGKPISIADSINDMAAYVHVTDGVFNHIAASWSPELRTAREILLRVKTRDFYAFLGETLVQTKGEAKWVKGTEIRIRDWLVDRVNKKLQCLPDGDPNRDFSVATNDIVVSENCINYGCKASNPVAEVFFYAKNSDRFDDGKKSQNPTSTLTELRGYRIDPCQIGMCLPSVFQEHWLRVHCKVDNEDIQELIGDAWVEYCKDESNNVAELTPSKTRPTPLRSVHKQIASSGIKRRRICDEGEQ